MRKIVFCLFVLALSACATVENVTDTMPIIGEDAPVRFSENPQVGIPGNRQYKKMTKSRMEEEAELGSAAGSMWQMDGQASYLFIQNKTRREGDVLNIKLEGAAQKQVETKVRVIKKLLKQIEEEEKAARGQQLAENEAKADASGRAPAAKAAEAKKPEEDEKADLSDIQTIPTRIVEKLPDGNYRIKGAHPFMIDKREYKVIVIGMIRPEDFNDEGVNSSKLLDPQFDVVSIRMKSNDSQQM